VSRADNRSSSRTDADAADVADRLHSAAIHLLRRLRKQDDATGVSAARLSALSVVVFGGPMTIGRLAEAEQVTAPTMTRLVAAMERDGLVQRERDASDARVTWVQPTRLGERVLRDGRRRRVAALGRALRELPAEDLSLLDVTATMIDRIALRLESGVRERTRKPSST
jgi:DNA-binding MarR family transcriptional regulator